MAAFEEARQQQQFPGTEMAIELLSPNPNNPEWRSQPPDDEEWRGFVATIKDKGVGQALTIVTRAAFLKAHPQHEDNLLRGSTHVIIMGHMRREGATQAGRKTVPVHVNDNLAGTDRLWFLIENKHRRVLKPIDEADIFAYYIKKGVPQTELASWAGVSQPYVSRRLALFKLTPAALKASENGQLGVNDVMVLAGQLPYDRNEPLPADGSTHPQDRALQLITESDWEAKKAAAFVQAAQISEAAAKARGLKLVDPKEVFGTKAARHRLFDEGDVEQADDAGTLVGAIDPETGELAFYTMTLLPSSGDDDKLRRNAQVKRRKVAAQLAWAAPPRDQLHDLLVRQYVDGTVAYAGEALRLAYRWGHEAGRVDAEDPAAWQAHLASLDPQSQVQAVWARAVAASEVRASKAEQWSTADEAYLRLLRERAKYEPSSWEAKQAALASEQSTPTP